MKKVKVIGGGISGLSAAYYLNRAGFQVDLFCEDNHLGGLVNTIKTNFGLHESAAHAFLGSVELREIAADIGCKLERAQPGSRRRYLIREGKVYRWPLKLDETVLLLASLLRFVFAPRSMKPRPLETLRSWGDRCLPSGLGRTIFETAMQGIYAGDPQKLSASLLLRPRMTKTKTKARGSFAPPGGMREFIDKLELKLRERGVSFYLGEKVPPLASIPEEPVVVATSALAASALLGIIDPPRSQALAYVDLIPMMSVTIAVDKAVVDGFGCLLPPTSTHGLLGVLVNSVIFSGRIFSSQQARHSETWIMGGAQHRNWLERSDRSLLEEIESARDQVFGLKEKIVDYEITRWPKAIPHYDLNLEKALPDFAENRKNIFLVGNYLGQIGLSHLLRLSHLLPAVIEARGSWTKNEGAQ